jgi:hypothetical protein
VQKDSDLASSASVQPVALVFQLESIEFLIALFSQIGFVLSFN